MKKKLLNIFLVALVALMGTVSVKAFSNVTLLYQNTNYSISAGRKFSTTATPPLTGKYLLASMGPDKIYTGSTTFKGYLLLGSVGTLKASRVYTFNASYAQWLVGYIGSGTWKMENDSTSGIGWSGSLRFLSSTTGS